MALIKLTQYRLEGTGWPSNADISFRLMGQPIGPDLPSAPVNTWNNCPSSSKLNFSNAGILQIFVDGQPRGTYGAINPVPVPRYNRQADFNTIYGIARVKYNVL